MHRITLEGLDIRSIGWAVVYRLALGPVVFEGFPTGGHGFTYDDDDDPEGLLWLDSGRLGSDDGSRVDWRWPVSCKLRRL